MTDRFGDEVTINRNSQGVPQSITSPDGFVTSLAIDGELELTGVSYPDATGYAFGYDPQRPGLLTTKDDLNGNHYIYNYDQNTGRVQTVVNPQTNVQANPPVLPWTYTSGATEGGVTGATATSPSGLTTSYVDTTDFTGAKKSIITDATGAQTEVRISPDGLTIEREIPCGTAQGDEPDIAISKDLDPEYGFEFVRKVVETLPSGLQRRHRSQLGMARRGRAVVGPLAAGQWGR